MKNKENVKKFIIRYAIIILGCVIYSLGVSLFLSPSNLAAGGVTGIAIALDYAIHLTGLDPQILDVSTIIVVINVPLFILGAIYFGKKFTASTLFSTLLSSALIMLWDYLFANFFPLPFPDNTILAALFGGAMFGIGLGLIFRMGSTTGGTDIVVKLLRKKFRYIRTGLISMIIDIVIVCISAIIYKDFELTCYTIISIVVFTGMFDWTLYGGNSAKLVYVIAEGEKSELICDRLLKELDVGATYVDGEGAYTGDEKRIIMCAVKNFMYPRLRDVVKDIDPKAFMIVTSAKEIYGEGYKDHGDEEL